MKLKKFLKPDWRKIIITTIIFAIWFLFLNGFKTFCSCSSQPCPNENYRNYREYIIFKDFCSCCVSLSELVYNYLWTLILPLTIAYILSCLIIWIYDKLRKVKKK